MNNNVSEYVEKAIKSINCDCDARGKEEVLTRIVTALTMGIVITLGLVNGGSGLPYLVYGINLLIRGLKSTIEYNSFRKRAEKEKQHLLNVKNKEEVKTEEDKAQSLIKGCVSSLSIITMQSMMRDIQSKNKIVSLFTYVSSAIAIANPNLIWVPILGLGASIIGSSAEVIYNSKIEKEKAQTNNLQHDIKIDSILQETQQEKAIVLEEKHDLESNNTSNKNIQKVEEIIESLINQNENVEEKSKEYKKTK